MLVWPAFQVGRLRPISIFLLGMAWLGGTHPLCLRGGEPPQSEPSPVVAGAIGSVQEEKGPNAGLATSDANPSPLESGEAKARRRGNAGRLPPYFAAVVDERQRQAIYEIRARRAGQLEQLEKQLEMLREEEMAEIEQVLTAEQREQVVSLRAKRTKAPASKSGARATK